MNINETFASHYLKAADLQGHDVTVTIRQVAFELVGRDRERKAVLYFVGKTKGVILNRTNAKKVVEIAGSALTEDWTGTVIVLYPTTTDFGGETVDCLRVKAVGSASRLPPVPAPRPVPKPEPVIQLRDDEVPF